MRIKLSGTRSRVAAVAAIVVVAFGAGFGIDHLAYSSGSGSAADSLTETAAPSRAPIYDVTANDPIPSPPANGSTVSFLATTPTHTIPDNWHAHTFQESCPDGWYVRPAQPDVSVPTSLNAAWIEHKSSTWIKSQNELTGPSGFYDPANTWSVFQSFTAKYTNTSADSSHSIYLQYWCDKVPSWYGTASSGTTSGSASSATTKPPAGAASSPVAGVGPDALQVLVLQLRRDDPDQSRDRAEPGLVQRRLGRAAAGPARRRQPAVVPGRRQRRQQLPVRHRDHGGLARDRWPVGLGDRRGPVDRSGVLHQRIQR